MELGLGLIEIGRPWGANWHGLPPEEQVERLLETALEEGVRFWDTASSYGVSEQRIGRFLRARPEALEQVILATKFGDVWEPGMPESYADHSRDALLRSLDRSMALLPRIDLLQVHRATEDALRREDLYKALEEARKRGIPSFGASVKTMEAARLAVESRWFKWLQIPYNPLRPEMEPAFELARHSGIRLLVNRPFAEGWLLQNATGAQDSPGDARRRAFEFLCQRRFDGFVLVGTKSPEHLRDNARLWREVAGSFTDQR